MTNDNVCKFVPSSKNVPADINAVNFVLESTDIAQTPAVK